MRIYPDNRVIYIDSTLYVGTTPIFYFPYFFQSLDSQSGYQFTPGYSSTNGEYLLAGLTFPITDHTHRPRAFLDYRSARRRRGADLRVQAQQAQENRAHRQRQRITPYASDDDPGEAAIVGEPDASPGNAAVNGDNTTAQNVNTNGESSGDNRSRRRHRNGGYVPTGEALSRQIRNREGATFLSFYLRDDQDRPQPHRARPLCPSATTVTGFPSSRTRSSSPTTSSSRPTSRRSATATCLQDFLRGRVHQEPQPGQRHLR